MVTGTRERRTKINTHWKKNDQKIEQEPYYGRMNHRKYWTELTRWYKPTQFSVKSRNNQIKLEFCRTSDSSRP